MAKLDHKKLAVIHIVKKELALSDEDYRMILKREAGVTSAKDLTEQGFRKLMNYLVRSRHYRLNRDGLTLKQKLFIEQLARSVGWDTEHLNHFIQKYYHRQQVQDLTRHEAIKAIESLKNVREHAERSVMDASREDPESTGETDQAETAGN